MANDDDHKMTRSQAASKAGQSQGKENNPGNFANDRKKAKKAGETGGEHSHSGGRKSDEA